MKNGAFRYSDTGRAEASGRHSYDASASNAGSSRGPNERTRRSQQYEQSPNLQGAMRVSRLSVQGHGHGVSKDAAKVLNWAAEIQRSIEFFLGLTDQKCKLSDQQMAQKLEELYHVQLDKTEKGLLQQNIKEILETLLVNIKAIR